MKIKLLLISIILLIFGSSILAQTTDATEKQKALKELVGLINQNNKAEDFFRAMSVQFSLMNEEIVKATLSERTDLTSAEKKSLEKTLSVDSQKYRKQLEDKLLEKLDFNAMTSEISLSVYDKFYSLEEINDLISFYKTKTGQKTLSLMQPLMLESMRLSQEKMTPKLIKVMEELRQEQKQILAKRLNELKPRKSN